MPALDGLAELIASQNPYTTGQVEDMDIHILPPTGNAGMQQADQEASQIDMEMDGGYPGSWDFKGVPQKLNKVLRIKYRYKVPNTNNPVRWRTAYLLIGFEDGSA